MRTIAHLSDLHFGRIDPEALEALEADLAEVKPSLVVISGDLVQRARRRHFRAARDFLERLPAPWLVVPGNHDIPAYNLLARFTVPFRNYRRYITPDLEPFICDDEIAVLGINTARPLILNFAHGRINRRQIEHIEASFHGVAPGVFKILVTHHPFLPPPHKPAGKILLGRARQALPALESCGVDLLLAGHYHRCFSGDISEHHSHLVRPMLVAHAATATSTRLRNEPNGYNLITIAPPAVTFEERTWSGGRFAAADRSTFIRTPHRWSPAPR
ncbi:MAG: metallophosphoesterase [Rhodospirillaceae bacterium]